MNLDFNFSPTCIGSMPDTDAEEICKNILNDFTELPFWPQLPKRSFLENMYAQFSEGLPNIKIDEKNKSIYIETSKNLTDSIQKTYEKYLSNEIEYFSITEKYAKGLYEFIKQFKIRKPKNVKFVKGQITGPISFGLTVTDETKQSIFYNQELQEVLTKVLCMKTRWQIRKLKEAHDNVIIFVDEPYMVSIGSSYVNIKAEDALRRINELIQEIHNEKAVAGIHCCGNTDWGLLLKTDIDIISFDAYNFSELISLYPDELKKFLKFGRCIAWGTVPTSSNKEENLELLLEKLNRAFDILAKKGIKKEDFTNSSIITPSCGCGTLSVSKSREVTALTLKISERLKKKI